MKKIESKFIQTKVLKEFKKGFDRDVRVFHAQFTKEVYYLQNQSKNYTRELKSAIIEKLLFMPDNRKAFWYSDLYQYELVLILLLKFMKEIHSTAIRISTY